ncbi:MAG: bifunctional oligoribonuclease/PAP phosphatase NrnA [Synergistaceae bacterium]|jgi:phosphoesterase RecJ-like protein|nr:bifunctional oligoribonuclease/PAP phosphatase NrnA [Synergistaceae bacterium]
MIEKILNIIENADNWLVLTHEKPDGDTLGCAVALAHFGGRMSKRVLLGCPDQCPERYAFLQNIAPVVTMRCLPDGFPGTGGVAICIDTSNAARSVPGLLGGALECLIVNIDHHIDNEEYGLVNWVDPAASATGEMVTELLFQSRWGIDPDEATALYAAIVSDNGSFSFPSTTLKSHECAMKLLNAGASPNDIAEKLDSNLSVGALRLWGRAISRAETFARGVCALCWITLEDFEGTGTTRQDTENLVNFLLRIKGVRLAALCSEGIGWSDEREVRVSLRARAPFNARAVAGSFGGGGHDLASGCTLQLPISDALDAIRGNMEKHASARFSANQ